jgi:hypothetical protein
MDRWQNSLNCEDMAVTCVHLSRCVICVTFVVHALSLECDVLNMGASCVDHNYDRLGRLLPVTTGCRWIGILEHVFDCRFTLAYIQSDTTYLLTRTVSF